MFILPPALACKLQGSCSKMMLRPTTHAPLPNFQGGPNFLMSSSSSSIPCPWPRRSSSNSVAAKFFSQFFAAVIHTTTG
ncbi:hypothetical protein R1flu_003164 [Riccia fluitans]|uniref:Uncharacterized protein n=1 Tax=Riccia fluitans TaxID=41844 RepID=A0ABD1Y949_9MARC